MHSAMSGYTLLWWHVNKIALSHKQEIPPIRVLIKVATEPETYQTPGLLLILLFLVLVLWWASFQEGDSHQTAPPCMDPGCGATALVVKPLWSLASAPDTLLA